MPHVKSKTNNKYFVVDYSDTAHILFAQDSIVYLYTSYFFNVYRIVISTIDALVRKTKCS